MVTVHALAALAHDLLAIFGAYSAACALQRWADRRRCRYSAHDTAIVRLRAKERL